MPIPTVTLDYTAQAKSVSATTLQAAMAAVPIPFDILTALGTYVATDVTSVSGSTVKRELVLKTAPTANATATASIPPGQNSGPIAKFTVTAPGSGYLTPPAVRIQDPNGSLADFLNSPRKGGRGQAYLRLVRAPNVISGGSGYSSATKVAFVGGFPLGLDKQETTHVTGRLGALTTRTHDAPFANGTVGSVTVSAPGRAYPPSSVILVLGDPPAVRPATFLPVLDAKGRLTSVIVTDGGAGYKKAPTLTLYDPTLAGSGAVLNANMQRGSPATATPTLDGSGAVTGFLLATFGNGYVSIPTVVITDPTGSGSGAAATAGPVIGGLASVMGVGRIDVLAGGHGYIAPAVALVPPFRAEFLGAAAIGDTVSPVKAFANLMKTAIQNLLATQVTESIS